VSLHLVLDTEKCTGHGRCYALAPDLFDSDDAGRSVLLVEDPSEAQCALAERAVANCPEQAITLT
jgi:ferredoxin